MTFTGTMPVQSLQGCIHGVFELHDPADPHSSRSGSTGGTHWFVVAAVGGNEYATVPYANLKCARTAVIGTGGFARLQ
jgi:hypothetical protein